MRRVLVCLAALASSAWAAPVAAYRPESLAGELRHLAVQVGEGKTPADLPAAWDVETGQRKYTISSEPLRILAGSAKEAPAVREWLEELAAQLERSNAAPTVSTKVARSKLDEILSAREFGAMRGPSAWDLWRTRVTNWFRQLLGKLLTPLAQHPQGTALVFWFAVIAALGTLAVWLFRYWTTQDWTTGVPASGGQIHLLRWEQWVRKARQASAKGDFRDAVRCAYWAGIAWLQKSGALPLDSARTPREYLRLAGADAPAAGPLSALTAGLERHWYGRRPAGAEDFANSLAHLEKLGCKED